LASNSMKSEWIKSNCNRGHLTFRVIDVDVIQGFDKSKSNSLPGIILSKFHDARIGIKCMGIRLR